MPLVGSGKIKIDGLKTMDDVITRMLRITNNEFNTGNRLKELHGIEGHERDVIDVMENRDVVNLLQDNESEKLISNLKRDYLFANVIETISKISSYNDKVCCVVYLISKGYLVKYPKEFQLKNIDTDFPYINADNERINTVIVGIEELIQSNLEKLIAVEDELRQNANEDVVHFVLDLHTREDLIRFQTGNFYRDLSRSLGEKFDSVQKGYLSDFLTKFKKQIKNSYKYTDAEYCRFFHMDPAVFEQRKYEALKPLVEMNALNLLA